jgi:hypothetical protein
MNGAHIGMNPAVIAAIYLALLLFGIGFNWFTAWVERKGYMKGYTSLFVVVGVAVTVAATAMISLAFALVTAGAFIASGTPMIVGSIWRHVQERERQLVEMRKDARDGDESQALAE